MSPVVAILPVKQFSLGKGRLADILTPEIRTRLGTALAARTADTALEAGMSPLIVAGDAVVRSWAESRHMNVVVDPGQGLNGAALAGVRWCLEESLPWIVIHTDLPLLAEKELRALADALTGAGAVISPSSDGGTTALGTSAGVPRFGYGPASFHRHLASVTGAEVVTGLGLFHDLDTPADLESARAHPLGKWIGDLVN